MLLLVRFFWKESIISNLLLWLCHHQKLLFSVILSRTIQYFQFCFWKLSNGTFKTRFQLYLCLFGILDNCLVWHHLEVSSLIFSRLMLSSRMLPILIKLSVLAPPFTTFMWMTLPVIFHVCVIICHLKLFVSLP